MSGEMQFQTGQTVRGTYPVNGVPNHPQAVGEAPIPSAPETPIPSLPNQPNSVRSAEAMIREGIKRYESHNGGFITVMSSNNVIACILATLTTLPFYLSIYWIRETYIGGLFWNLFAVAITLFTLIALYSLALKVFGLVAEKWKIRKFQWQGDQYEQFSPEVAESLLNDLEENRGGKSLLARRLRDGLHYLKARKSHAEIQDYLETQSERDEHALQASFSTIRLIIWSLPILGFIGTVWGIGIAVDDFAGVVRGDADIDQIKTSLTGVTGGLATAFETTLLALVMSMIVMFPKNFVQKAAEELMIQIDRQVEERLLQKIHERVQVSKMEPQDFLAAFDDVLNRYQAQWAKQCELLAKSMGQYVGRKFQQQFERSEESNRALVQQFEVSLAESVTGLGESNKQLGELQVQANRQAEQLLTNVDQTGGQLESKLGELSVACSRMGEQMERMQSRHESFVATADAQIGQMQSLGHDVGEHVRNAANALDGARQVVLPHEVQQAIMKLGESAGPLAQSLQEQRHTPPLPIHQHHPAESQPGFLQRLFPMLSANSSMRGTQSGSVE